MRNIRPDLTHSNETEIATSPLTPIGGLGSTKVFPDWLSTRGEAIIFRREKKRCEKIRAWAIILTGVDLATTHRHEVLPALGHCVSAIRYAINVGLRSPNVDTERNRRTISGRRSVSARVMRFLPF